MPVTPTYPGVYLQEIPSGVVTISGVATSITAFIGAATRGPLDEPTEIASFGDFERQFGGISASSMMSYAVRDFYLNGGSTALIVRVAKADASEATISLPAGSGAPLVIMASSPGAWGNNLSAAVVYPQLTSPPDPATIGAFHLYLFETVNGRDVNSEKFFNLVLDPNAPTYIGRVLENNSTLAQLGTISTTRPDSTQTFTSPPGPLQFRRISATPNSGFDGSPIGTNELMGDQNDKTGIYALDKADLFNLLCIAPPARGTDTDPAVYQAAVQYCVDRRAMLLVDPPAAWGAREATAAQQVLAALPDIGISGPFARNAALFFPRIVAPDPAMGNQPEEFVPSGAIAGIFARTDSSRGVWKAPAGLDATFNGISDLQVRLTDAENGQLNPVAVNCLRSFRVGGRVVWGARTMRGADEFSDDYKYIPVRRLALFIEESLYRGTQWAVFEPNDEPLWAELRQSIGAFMQTLFLQGAFAGRSASEAYLVKVDSETTTPTDAALGVVNVLVGFAPLRPAEFIIISLQLMVGATTT